MIMNSNSYFNSANMNYIFNVEYFENAKDSMINKLNKDIENFEFPKINTVSYTHLTLPTNSLV